MEKYNIKKIGRNIAITGLVGLLSLGVIKGCGNDLDSKCGKNCGNEITKGMYRVMSYDSKGYNKGYEDNYKENLERDKNEK